MDLSDIRRLTPAVQNYTYFQTSGFSPKPEPVIEEVIRWLRFQNQGPASSEIHPAILAMFEGVREKVGRVLNASPDEIMLSENTTVGINVVAFGIDWQPGDNVILTTHEHPGNRVTWYNLVERYGIELRFIDAALDDAEFVQTLDGMITPRTRLLSLSHVSRHTGRRFPAREIVIVAQRHGVPVLFDGAQSFGAIPVDVEALDCDFYTFGGHKYIMAPQGTGGCYIRRDRIDWLQPSWIGSHSEKRIDPWGQLELQDGAKRFEFGTRNLADQAGFGKALDLWAEIGWERVFHAIAAYTDRMKVALLTVPGLVLETPLPYDQSSGIVTFHLPGVDAYVLTRQLFERQRILVSPLNPASPSVRVSTHVFNTNEDIDRLVTGIRDIHRQLGV